MALTAPLPPPQAHFEGHNEGTSGTPGYHESSAESVGWVYTEAQATHAS